MITNKLKTTKHFFVLLTIILVSCKGQTQKLGQQKDVDNPIATIAFQVETDNKKDYEDGLIPWASIEKANQDIPNLHQKDEVVIKESVVKIIIDYPLKHPYEFSVTSEKGFTRSQLLKAISRHYFKLYNEEENSATVKTIPVSKRTTTYNRNETNGKYGIWGHDIADLVLSEIQVFKATNGEIRLTLVIES